SSASPQRRHRPVLGLPGSRNLRYSPVTALTALDSRIGTPSLPLSFPRTLAYRCSMLLCFCFSNEFFFCPARVNCDTVSQGGRKTHFSLAKSDRTILIMLCLLCHSSPRGDLVDLVLLIAARPR